MEYLNSIAEYAVLTFYPKLTVAGAYIPNNLE